MVEAGSPQTIESGQPFAATWQGPSRIPTGSVGPIVCVAEAEIWVIHQQGDVKKWDEERNLNLGSIKTFRLVCDVSPAFSREVGSI